MKEFQRPPLALYIHWPFCVSQCPYCDFNSHVRASVDQEVWKAALIADLAYEAGQMPDRTLGSIFFGGGTPSLMPPTTVAALIDSAAQHWSVADTIEITLEANPSSVEAARFADLARAGINRSSLGIQALNGDVLRFLGRAHSVDDGLAALSTAQRIFSRVSFDLIYARPGQTAQDWARELNRAIDFGTEHLSLYQLTIEPGTRFATLVQQGKLNPIPNDDAADLFEATRETTTARGLPAYEISNHARPGAECRHNLAYWRYHDYVGIGPGAHGRRNGTATIRHKKPENWMAAVARNGHGTQTSAPLSGQQRATEALLMGLRLNEGVDLYNLRQASGVAEPVNHEAIERLAQLELITLVSDRLTVTERGMIVLDSILPEIIAS